MHKTQMWLKQHAHFRHALIEIYWEYEVTFNDLMAEI